jgi:glycerophosphoryl diester phosphodiesterase
LTEVIAHRGASGDAPENTPAAFDLALAQGADALEFDVRAAADGSLVTVHDPTLARTTGDERAVEELTGDELRRLDHPAQPTTLEAVLARYGSRTRLFIDLKDPTPQWEHRVLEAIDRHGVADRVTLQSFDTDALVRLHALAPALAYATVYRRADSVDIDIDAIPAFATGMGPWHPHVDADLVARARARGPPLGRRRDGGGRAAAGARRRRAVHEPAARRAPRRGEPKVRRCCNQMMLRRALAILVLVIVAAIALRLALGVVVGVFHAVMWIVIAVALVVAVVWANRTLKSTKKDRSVKRSSSREVAAAPAEDPIEAEMRKINEQLRQQGRG